MELKPAHRKSGTVFREIKLSHEQKKNIFAMIGVGGLTHKQICQKLHIPYLTFKAYMELDQMFQLHVRFAEAGGVKKINENLLKMDGVKDAVEVAKLMGLSMEKQRHEHKHEHNLDDFLKGVQERAKAVARNERKRELAKRRKKAQIADVK